MSLHQAVKFSPTPETLAHEKATIEDVEAAIAQLGEKLTADGSSLQVQGVAAAICSRPGPNSRCGRTSFSSNRRLRG